MILVRSKKTNKIVNVFDTIELAKKHYKIYGSTHDKQFVVVSDYAMKEKAWINLSKFTK